MKGKLLIVLLLCFAMVGMAAAKWDTSSGDDSSTDSGDTEEDENNEAENEEEESVEFPDEGFNIYSRDDFVSYADKMFVSGTESFGDLPKKGAFKVPSLNGWVDDGELKDAGWNQISTDFWASEDVFITDAEERQYDDETKKFNAGEPTSLSMHATVIGRFLQYAADYENEDEDGNWLPEGAKLTVPKGTLYWQVGNQIYQIPAFGALSYKSDQTGQFWYPSLNEGERKFQNDLAEAPYELDTTSDIFGWYTVERSE